MEKQNVQIDTGNSIQPETRREALAAAAVWVAVLREGSWS